MGNVTSVSLTEEAYQILQDYMNKKKCSRNKAINEIIKATGKELGLDRRRGKAILQVTLEINDKLDELKAILTNKNEVKNNETSRTN